MKQIFMQHTVLTVAMIVLLLFSIICQIIIGLLYQNMIKETDNMSSTDNKLLKQCKLKFVNCFQMNDGVSNIPVFVDKFMNRLRFAGINLTALHHISGQFVLLSVFCAGVGVYQGIVSGEKTTQILPYFIFSFFGLYLYFSLLTLVDIQGKRRILKTNLVDYLENHMVSRLNLAIEEEPEPDKKHSKKETEKESRIPAFTKSDAKELEELLKEFLA